MSVGEYTCNPQTTSEGDDLIGSESTLLVAFLIAHLCHRLIAERKSPVNVEKRSGLSKWIMTQDDHVALDPSPSCNRKSRGPGNTEGSF